uniref:Uncharacterized protein n=1 Tax=Tanacetum cinerariifolium TaxID=118510 RepID=A0A6L2JVY5_TANCI|nr:hypothetical protein [Tanacetum cinerariifolium]
MIISIYEYLTHLSGGGVIDLTDDEDPTDEDGYTEMDYSTGVSASLGGEISSGGRKSWESNSDNTGDIIVGEAIGACSGGIVLRLPIGQEMDSRLIGEIIAFP